MRSVILVITNLLKHIKPNKGSVTIVALVVMIVLGALGATLIKQSSSRNKVSASYSDGIAAQYLAEAGIQHAKAEIKKQHYPTAATGANSLASVVASVTTNKIGNYSVLISPPVAGVYTITSTGTVNGASRQVVKTCSHPVDVYGFAAYGGTGEDDALGRGVSLYPSVNIVGDVGSNGNVAYGTWGLTSIVFGDITIDGNVDAKNRIDSYPGFEIKLTTGHKQTPHSTLQVTIPTVASVPTVIFPSNESSFALLSSVRTTTYSSLDLIHSFPRYNYALTNNNTYYQDGNLTLNNHLGLYFEKITGNGTIIINGNLVLDSGTHIDGNVTLIVRGNVTTYGDFKGITTISATKDVTIAGTLGAATIINANGNVSLESGSSIKDDITIDAIGNIQVNTDTPINYNAILHANGDFTLNPGYTMSGDTLVMAQGDIWVGTGIGYPFGNLTTFPAYIDKGVLLANGNIFINNLNHPLYGSVIARKKITLYGNADIRYDKDIVAKMKTMGLP